MKVTLIGLALLVGSMIVANGAPAEEHKTEVNVDFKLRMYGISPLLYMLPVCKTATKTHKSPHEVVKNPPKKGGRLGVTQIPPCDTQDRRAIHSPQGDSAHGHAEATGLSGAVFASADIGCQASAGAWARHGGITDKSGAAEGYGVAHVELGPFTLVGSADPTTSSYLLVLSPDDDSVVMKEIKEKENIFDETMKALDQKPVPLDCNLKKDSEKKAYFRLCVGLAVNPDPETEEPKATLRVINDGLAVCKKGDKCDPTPVCEDGKKKEICAPREFEALNADDFEVSDDKERGIATVSLRKDKKTIKLLLPLTSNKTLPVSIEQSAFVKAAERKQRR